MRKHTKLIWIIAVAMLMSSGCTKEDSSTGPDIKKVEVTQITKEKMYRKTDLAGTLLPYETTVVSFEVPGRVTELVGKEGDEISIGSILAKINEKDYALQLEQAQTNIKRAEAGLKQADAAIEETEAVVKQAEASVNQANAGAQQAKAGYEQVLNGARPQEISQAQAVVDKAQVAYDKAQYDLEKVDRLYQKGAVSENQFTNAKRALEVAEKDLDAAKQQYSLVTEGARSEQKEQMLATYEGAAAVKEKAKASQEQALSANKQASSAKEQTSAARDQAVIAAQQASVNVDRTNLKAPVNGTVITKYVSEGQMVGAGTPVYMLGDTTKLKVILPVPDKEIGGWKAGDLIQLSLYDKTKEGTVTNIFPSAAQGSGTIGVEVVIDNTAQDWYAGQVVTAVHSTDIKDTLFVPVGAVMSVAKEKYVFRFADGKAVKTPVAVGEIANNKFEIISGIKEGEIIIAKGADRLLDGENVEPLGGKQE